MIPYIVTNVSLTVVLKGKAYTIKNDHPSFNVIKKALSEERFDEIESHLDLGKAVVNYTDGNVVVKDGQIFVSGEAVHNYTVGKILDFMKNGLPYKPLVKFVGKLMLNPSRRSVNELYRFLENRNMPLTPDGNFLAYKGVSESFMDKYTGKFNNAVGQVLSMSRNQVCDDSGVGCSYGFHAGSYEYAKGYATNGGHLMVVEIDPQDVVSVPNDCEFQKLRTAKYKVVGLYESIDNVPLDDNYCSDYDEDEGEDDAWVSEGKKVVSEETRKKLSDKALSQVRDENGKFI